MISSLRLLPWGIAACVAALVLLAPAPGRADVVSTTRSCPAGATSPLCHSGGQPLCLVVACVDGACGAGATCQRRSVCSSGLRCTLDGGPPTDGGVDLRRDVVATCSPGDTCGGTTDCIDEDVCVASSSGCAVTPDGGIASAIALVVAALAFVVVRRARR